jgi:predicted GIY-YIG superfamily endonuclease
MNWEVYGIFHMKTQNCIYVGQTRRDLRRRFSEHSTKKYPWIARYMKMNGSSKNYIIEVLKSCKTLQDALEWENHYILELHPRCNVKTYG